ncbi:MAG: hypothetical protein WCP69_06790 [Bacteroidota bacterium]
MKQLLIILLLCFGFTELFGQDLADTIVVKEGIKTTFFQNGKAIPPYNLKKITESNNAAYEEMVAANLNYKFSYFFQFAGGALVGFPIGTAIGGGNPKWYLAGIGAVLIFASIPFSIEYAEHGKKGAQIYNDGLKKTSMINHFDVNFGLSAQGLGMKINF